MLETFTDKYIKGLLLYGFFTHSLQRPGRNGKYAKEKIF